MLKRSLNLITGSVLLASSGMASATIINGGFEDGDFTGWSTIGATSIETAAFGSGPTGGTYDALLTTGEGSVTDAALEGFLGLTGGSLDFVSPSGQDVTEGSAIFQTFGASAGDVLTFDWNFLTDEIPAPLEVIDYAFFDLFYLDVLADADINNTTLVSSASIYADETGFSTESINLLGSGLYTIAFGVVDTQDYAYDSALLVDNVALNAASVPEPSTLALIGLGLAGIGFRRRKVA